MAEPSAIPTPVCDSESGYPFLASDVALTPAGTPYLCGPGIHIIGRTVTRLNSLSSFLTGFGEECDFGGYINDPVTLPDGAALCKVAGQLCYASLGPKRTMNRDAARYFKNIRESGHGSVLEHACYSALFYGISRSLTHELVRHRAGFGFSMISQRYVSGKVLRFVERPEYQSDSSLHALFVERIERASAEYSRMTEMLLKRQQQGAEILSADARTDLRKKVQQTARSVLPNETEAPIVVTANARAWRHFVEMRANPHAETEIRALAFGMYQCLAAMDQLLFGDYVPERQTDGTWTVSTTSPKV